MSKTRTTAALIRNAIEAAYQAGFDVGAVEVMPGGAVRILPPASIPMQDAGQGGNTCDDLFPADSD